MVLHFILYTVKLGLLWASAWIEGVWGEDLELQENEEICNEGIHKLYK
jgi:hypothetical protein